MIPLRFKLVFRKILLSTTGLTAVAIAVAAVTSVAAIAPAYANPEGGVVSAGSAVISGTGTDTVHIHQSSDRAVIDWSGFDIAPHETTQFFQPSATSVTLNRVHSDTPSFIDGRLSANGNIFIVNQNGVLFGGNARVDVNGLVATTANITSANLMAGDFRFDRSGNPNGVVANTGMITARDAGLVGLVAPNVMNAGIITAKLGRVHLASGDIATVDLYGDGLIEMATNNPTIKRLVENSGQINAAGGTIAITAAAGADMVNSLVRVMGELRAPSVGIKNGKIVIYGEGSNAVKNNIASDKGQKQGTSTVIVQDAILDASGRNTGERGGTVAITGDHVAVMGRTIIDASGHTGLSNTTKDKEISDVRTGAAGGDIQIGGDYLGDGATPTAQNLYVGEEVLVLNDAVQTGDAGRTIFWSDDTTQFYGNIYARALGGQVVDVLSWNATSGGNGGDGGFVETSGHKHLDAGGYVDLTASNSGRGTYFLDPTDITIYGSFDPTDISDLRLWLDGSDQSTLFTDDAGTTQVINGSAVAVWRNKSGNSNNAIQTSSGVRPVWQANGQNGNGTVYFDGSTLFDLPNLMAGAAAGSGFFTAINDADPTGNPFATGSPFGNWGTGQQSHYVWTDGNIYDSFGSDTRKSAGNPVPSLTDVSVYSVISANNSWGNYINDQALYSTNGNTVAWNATPQIGVNNGYYYAGKIAEMIVYGSEVSLTDRQLLNQYQSAKWGVRLIPPGVASVASDLAEATAAMTHDVGDPTKGYSVFTTRYLERLSQSANVSLQASNNITLDLKGDTMNLATAGRSLTLNAGNQITTASAGTITTNNAAISLTGSNGILFNNNFALNSGGGNISFNNAVNGAGVLTVNSGAGTTNFSSTVGATTALGGLNVTGATTINNNITTNNAAMTFNSAVTLGNNAVLNAGTGTITTGSTVNGAYNLTATADTFSFGGAIGGTTPLSAVSLTSTNALTLPFISAATILARTTGATSDVTIAAGKTLTASGAGTALTIAAGRDFINNSGSATPFTLSGGGRSVVYSTDPGDDTLGGMTGAFVRYGCTYYGGSCPVGVTIPGTGNGFAYTTQPTLTVTPSALAVTYGAAVPTLSPYLYGVSGYLTGAAGADSGTDVLSGSLTATTTYTPTSLAGTYGMTYASGTLASTLGYQFTYGNNVTAITVTGAPPTTTITLPSTFEYVSQNAIPRTWFEPTLMPVFQNVSYQIGSGASARYIDGQGRPVAGYGGASSQSRGPKSGGQRQDGTQGDRTNPTTPTGDPADSNGNPTQDDQTNPNDDTPRTPTGVIIEISPELAKQIGL